MNPEDPAHQAPPASLPKQLASNAMIAVLAGCATLGLWYWRSASWEFVQATRVALAVLSAGMIGTLFRNRTFSIGSILLAVLFLSIGLAGWQISTRWLRARKQRMAVAEKKMWALVGENSAFLQSNGKATIVIEDANFSNESLRKLMAVVDASDDVHLYFLGLYTPQMNDASLEIVGKRSKLVQLLIDGNLVSRDGLARFRAQNPKCNVNTNVVTRRLAQSPAAQSPAAQSRPSVESQ